MARAYKIKSSDLHKADNLLSEQLKTLEQPKADTLDADLGRGIGVILMTSDAEVGTVICDAFDQKPPKEKQQNLQGQLGKAGLSQDQIKQVSGLITQEGLASIPSLLAVGVESLDLADSQTSHVNRPIITHVEISDKGVVLKANKKIQLDYGTTNPLPEGQDPDLEVKSKDYVVMNVSVNLGQLGASGTQPKAEIEIAAQGAKGKNLLNQIKGELPKISSTNAKTVEAKFQNFVIDGKISQLEVTFNKITKAYADLYNQVELTTARKYELDNQNVSDSLDKISEIISENNGLNLASAGDLKKSLDNLKNNREYENWEEFKNKAKAFEKEILKQVAEIDKPRQMSTIKKVISKITQPIKNIGKKAQKKYRRLKDRVKAKSRFH